MKEEMKNLKALFIYKTILSCSLKGRKNTKSKNPKVSITKRGKPTLLSKCTVCGNKTSRFIRKASS